MSDKNDLPDGWYWCKFDDVVEVMRNGTNASQNQKGKGIPVSRIETISNSYIDYEKVRHIENPSQNLLEKYLLQDGDLLFSHINSATHLGKTAIYLDESKPLLHGMNLMLLRLRKLAISPRLFNFLCCYYRAIGKFSDIAQHAVNQASINQEKLKTVIFPLPPVKEQHRIVTKIEELFSQLDKGVAALERAKANLKRYRASVLKAAVEGKLTEAWRAANPPEEPAFDLLKRILAERRRRWEKDQLARYKAKGQSPSANWKSKYKEPAQPDTSKLPDLPEGWCWATVDQLSFNTLIGLDRGKSLQTIEPEGSPYIKMNNLTMEGQVFTDELVYVPVSEEEKDKYKIQRGDILFNTRNSKELVGKVGIVRSVLQNTVFNNNLMRIRTSIDPRWLCYQMCSRDFRLVMELVKKATTNVAAIYANDLLPLPVAIPPLTEQSVISDEIDRLLSISFKCENVCSNEIKRSSRLRQSILKYAFEGKLVPQDPNDEPAERLLERIRAERAKTRNSPKARKGKPRKKIAKGQSKLKFKMDSKRS